jgi:maltooligosyltrehalose trehalohydrolase
MTDQILQGNETIGVIQTPSNLGCDLQLVHLPEPLLAPPEESRWELLWTSEFPWYGGSGTPKVENDEYWLIPVHAATVLAPKRVVMFYKVFGLLG